MASEGGMMEPQQVKNLAAQLVDTLGEYFGEEMDIKGCLGALAVVESQILTLVEARFGDAQDWIIYHDMIRDGLVQKMKIMGHA